MMRCELSGSNPSRSATSCMQGATVVMRVRGLQLQMVLHLICYSYAAFMHMPRLYARGTYNHDYKAKKPSTSQSLRLAFEEHQCTIGDERMLANMLRVSWLPCSLFNEVLCCWKLKICDLLCKQRKQPQQTTVPDFMDIWNRTGWLDIIYRGLMVCRWCFGGQEGAWEGYIMAALSDDMEVLINIDTS